MGVAEFITVASVWAGQERKTRGGGGKVAIFFFHHPLFVDHYSNDFVFVFLYSTDLDGAVIGRQGLGGVVVAIHSSLMKQQLLIRNGDGEHAV